jgi:hypothetical protein
MRTVRPTPEPVGTTDVCRMRPRGVCRASALLWLALWGGALGCAGSNSLGDRSSTSGRGPASAASRAKDAPLVEVERPSEESGSSVPLAEHMEELPLVVGPKAPAVPGPAESKERDLTIELAEIGAPALIWHRQVRRLVLAAADVGDPRLAPDGERAPLRNIFVFRYTMTYRFFPDDGSGAIDILYDLVQGFEGRPQGWLPYRAVRIVRRADSTGPERPHED